MCGIFGVVGDEFEIDVLLDGISKLEYRGYDSSGFTVPINGQLLTIRSTGNINELTKRVEENFTVPVKFTSGMIHTRWATHGTPGNIRNSHPLLSSDGKISIIHNGIIENANLLKTELETLGYSFDSETDSEVIANLISSVYNDKFTPDDFKLKVLDRLKGSYAICVMFEDKIDEIFFASYKSPLVLGLCSDDSIIISSDVTPISDYTNMVYHLIDGDYGCITKANSIVNGKKFEFYEIDEMTETDIFKNGYEHYMKKEIFEQATTLEETIKSSVPIIHDSEYNIRFDDIVSLEYDKIDRIIIVGCGTAYNAGLVGRNIIEDFTGIPVQVEFSSDFRYRKPLFNNRTLVIAISQSGETTDTIEAIKIANSNGAQVLGIINSDGSTMTRLIDNIIFTKAGKEISVASTKSFTSQMVALHMFGLMVGCNNGTISESYMTGYIEDLRKLPCMVNDIIYDNNIDSVVKHFKSVNSALFIGRGDMYPIALEGALKLKEISYIHAEGFHSSELKHGSLALVEPDVPVVVLAPRADNYYKVLNNAEEVKTRGGTIIAIIDKDDIEMQNLTDNIIRINSGYGHLDSILATIPLQLLAYYVALSRDCNIDQPRNLAKSVTVE